MAIKKVSDGPITMTVSEAKLVEGQYGTQVQFIGFEEGEAEDTLLYISERSAIRQLERLSLTVEGCAGETLAFTQVQKDGKTYNNIHRATAGAAPANRAPAKALDMDAQITLYNTCLSAAARAVLAMAEETGVAVTGSDIVAAAATLFIQANRR